VTVDVFKAKIDAEDDKGNTALFNAALAGDLNCCNLLLKYGANINHKNEQGNTCLHVVCVNYEQKKK
jgi:ankyrin repeat protein